MITEISNMLSNLQVNYDVTYDVASKYDKYEIANIQEKRVVDAFNLLDGGHEFKAVATSELFPGDHVKNRDIGDIIIKRIDTDEVVASIDLKVATFSLDPEMYGPISMSSAYNFSGWNGNGVNSYYMLVNGRKHDKVKFISVNKVKRLLDDGRVKVLLTKNVKTTNRVSSEEYASRGWDKNILKWSDKRSYLVDEDYIGTKCLSKYTSDIMC